MTLVHIEAKQRQLEGARARTEPMRQGQSSAGVECPHVAVDDRSHVLYVEELSDERKEASAAFVLRTHAYFASLEIRGREYMTDNGPGYRSAAFAGTLISVGASHIFTRPYSPW